MKFNLLAVFFVLFCWSLTANALVLGGSNFDLLGYPKHECYKPYKPYEFVDEYQYQSYVNEAELYFDCIREYVENAERDIERIQDAAKEAIAEAKSE